MPISAIDGCSAEHWAEVKAVLTEAIEAISELRFSVKLVSDADESGVIQKRIVQNIYGSEIVVCDVSGKNPNVMFELGLRLAFDKPTVIIKDDKTDYSFDTAIIEHIPYPRDLRFAKIVDFKKSLSVKVLNTYKASLADSNHSPFLKNFGRFQVAALTQTEVSPDKMVLEMLSEIQSELSALKRGDELLKELVKEQRLAHSVDVIMRLGNRWESQEMMRPRKEFSKRLLDKQPMNDSARQLLAFFETVGVVVNRAGIDPYIVWSEFCWHAKHYYAALADAIKETRQQTKDPTLYNQFEWVNDELLKIDAKERAITLDDAKPNIHDLETFFKGECELMVELMVPVNEKKAKDPNQQLQPDEKSGHV